MIGVVDCTETDTHQVINVEFHDKSTRRGYHFQDHSSHTMASLGEQGIAYAAPASPDAPSTVHYRPYDSWATQADWTQNLPAGESATCVAVGGPPEGAGVGSVVVSTSNGLLRFFTASGVQRYIWRLGEDVVTMAAGRDGLIVVYREGGTSLDGTSL
jgi:chromosome transmission fidelity protein 4